MDAVYTSPCCSARQSFWRGTRHLVLLSLVLATAACSTGAPGGVVSISPDDETYPENLTPVTVTPGGEYIRYGNGDKWYIWNKCSSDREVGSYTRKTHNSLALKCSVVTANGIRAELEPLPSRPWIRVDDNLADIAPVDAVVTEEHLTMGYHLDTRSAFAYLKVDGRRLIVRPDAEWTQDTTGCPRRLMVSSRNGWVLCADGFETDQPRPETAKITIRHWHTKLPCSFSIPTGPVGERRYFPLEWRAGEDSENEPWSPCHGNTAESIELEKLPSAAQILLTDDVGCSRRNDGDRIRNKFWIELRTTSKSVTISALKLDEILTYSKGDIVSPGLRLIDYHKEDVQATRKLSCIMVATSSAPPA